MSPFQLVRSPGPADQPLPRPPPFPKAAAGLGALACGLLASLALTRRRARRFASAAGSDAERVRHENDARFHAMTDNMPQLAWMTRPDGWITWYNRRWFDYTGATLEGMQGWGWRAVHHPDHVERVTQRFRDAVATGEAWEDTFPLRGRDGAYRWFLSRALPIRDASGQVAAWFGTNTDVTEQRDAETALSRLNDELEARVAEAVAAREAAQARAAQAERMQVLGQLAGGIAHDFNNVLQAVAGGASLIERKPGDPERVARWAVMVNEAAARGASITRRLLTFARRGDLRAAPVDAAELVAGLREVLTHALGAGIEVRVELEAGLPPLLADRGQLETTLVNLAVNARDAMPGGGVLTISAWAEAVAGDASHPAGRPVVLPPGRYVRLLVADTGHGMSAATLAHATEPFFTTKGAGKGTGLGLSMAKGFAQQSGGELVVESAPGQGAAVTLWLPQAEEVAPARTAGPVERIEAAAPAGGRVLLVDDDGPVRETLAAQLADAGYGVVSARGGEEALELLAAGEGVDVLVTDLSMPGLDGLALIREAQARQAGLPAVLLTGYAGDGAALAVRGSFALLRKPVQAAQLIDQIEALLEAAPDGRAVALLAEQ